MMDYKVTANTTNNPHLDYVNLKEKLNTQIIKDGKDPLHYITQTTNTDEGIKITATYSEERKQHFIDHPLGS